MSRPIPWLTAIGLFAVSILIAQPLAGWPAVMRLPAVLVPVATLAVLVLRPWRWTEAERRRLDAWAPSSRVVWVAALVLGAALFWIVLTRFKSGEVNAVDFTVYFDRPAFQTIHGRPLFVETAEQPQFGQRSELAVHAFWAMLPFTLLYAISATPLWLLGASVLAVVLGARHVLRIMQALGAGGVLASAAALAFALNRNTAQVLNYGFHAEVFYMWFVPWLIDAGVRGDRRSFVAATIACVLVKEDACMPIFAASLALALNRFGQMTRADRALFLVFPTALSLIHLAFYYSYVVPMFNVSGVPTYAGFWASYGPTPFRALGGMLSRPVDVVRSALVSGFFTTSIAPHLFLPILGWRWTLGALPIVMLYAVADNDQIRHFGVYYPVIFIPFLVIGASTGALTVAKMFTANVGRTRWMASVAVLTGALVVGSTTGGYSLRPWRPEIAALPGVLAGLRAERVVLVQSSLYPHAGYDERVKLLTPATLHDSENSGAAVVVADAMSPYPFTQDQWSEVERLPEANRTSSGLVVGRIPDATR